MSVNSIAMGVEERRTNYRFNRYLFPFVDCTITLYAESGEPVPISDIADCMRDYHGITGVRNVYEGRDAALENGYIRAVPVGGRRGYVPTPLGVIDNALVNHHLDVIMDFYVNYGREALPELLTALRNYLLIDLIQRVSITMLRMFTIKDIFKLGEHDREELRSLLPLMSMHLRLKQDDLFGAWLTLKALAGLMREQDLGPRECMAMREFLMNHSLYLVNGFIGPYMISLSIRNKRFRSWASAITYLNYLFLHSAFRNKGTE